MTNETEAIQIATEAKTRISTHEEICAERYQNIINVQTENKKEIKSLRNETISSLKEIYSRLWKFAGAIIGLLLAILLIFLKEFLSK